MLEDLEIAQLTNTTKGGIDVSLDDEDVMIDVKGFYTDHLEDSHQKFPTENAD